MSPRVLVRGLFLIATLVAAGILVERTGLGAHFDQAWIDSEVRGRGALGQALFVAAATVFTGIGLPRQLVGFLGGYAFGFAAGSGLALLGTVLGCFLAFHYARILGRRAVKGRFPDKVQKLDAFLRDNPIAMTVLIRLLPVGNNLITNLAAGVSSVKPLRFVIGSAVGYVPQTAVFALAGSGVNVDHSLRIGLSAVLFVASAVIGVWLYRKYRHGQTFDDAVEDALGAARGADETGDRPPAP